MDEQIAVRFEHFTFQYYAQAEPTLHDINLEIRKHEKVLIVGPSGSGKSTLAHCINGLIPFAFKGKIEGKLELDGQDTAGMNIFDRSIKVGTVLQDSDTQFVGLSVAEDIAFAMENDCVPQEEMKRRVAEVGQIVGVDSILGSEPSEISGGQKQRTTLAGVLVNHAEILLFDEPLANLDPATGKTAIEIIDTVHRTQNKTTIIIEHRLEDVLHRPVDRIILMKEGRILADTDPHSLCASSLLVANGIREPLYLSALKRWASRSPPTCNRGIWTPFACPRTAWSSTGPGTSGRPLRRRLPRGKNCCGWRTCPSPIWDRKTTYPPSASPCARGR